jgi:hypothetical protein
VKNQPTPIFYDYMTPKWHILRADHRRDTAFPEKGEARTVGPVSTAKLLKLASLGRVRASDLVLLEGTGIQMTVERFVALARSGDLRGAIKSPPAEESGSNAATAKENSLPDWMANVIQPVSRRPPTIPAAQERFDDIPQSDNVNNDPDAGQIVAPVTYARWQDVDAESHHEEPQKRPRRALLVVGAFLVLCCVGLGALIVILLSNMSSVPVEASDAAGTTLVPTLPKATTPASGRDSQVERIPMPLIVLNGKDLGNSMDKYRGQRIMVVGRIKKLGNVGFSQETLWDVGRGLGFASLGDGGDRPDVTCVFSGPLPTELEMGQTGRITGTVRGLIATAGVPLLVECELTADQVPD